MAFAGTCGSVGTSVLNVNLSAAEAQDGPPLVTTLTSTSPAACCGAVTVNVVVEATVTAVPGVSPNSTAVTWLKFVPVSRTRVPPASSPAFGASMSTDGVATNVYRSAGVATDVPLAVVTRTWTVPASWAGAATTSLVADTTEIDEAATVPNATPDTPVNPLPVTVTRAPTAVRPDDGDTAVTAGPAAAVAGTVTVTIPATTATVITTHVRSVALLISAIPRSACHPWRSYSLARAWERA